MTPVHDWELLGLAYRLSATGNGTVDEYFATLLGFRERAEWGQQAVDRFDEVIGEARAITAPARAA